MCTHCYYSNIKAGKAMMEADSAIISILTTFAVIEN